MTSFVSHICTDTCPLPLFFPCLDDDTLCPALRRKVLGRTAGGTTASVSASVERCSENDLDMVPSTPVNIAVENLYVWWVKSTIWYYKGKGKPLTCAHDFPL